MLLAGVCNSCFPCFSFPCVGCWVISQFYSSLSPLVTQCPRSPLKTPHFLLAAILSYFPRFWSPLTILFKSLILCVSVSCTSVCLCTMHMPDVRGGQKRASVVLELELQKVWGCWHWTLVLSKAIRALSCWASSQNPWQSLKTAIFSLILWESHMPIHCVLTIFITHNLSRSPYFLLFLLPTSYSSLKGWVSEFWGTFHGWIYLMFFYWLDWKEHACEVPFLVLRVQTINTLPGCWWSWLWSRGSICWVCTQWSDFLCLSILGSLKRNL